MAIKPTLTLQERTVKASQARMGFCQLESELRWTPDPGSFSLGAPQIRGRNSSALGFPPSATLMAADRLARKSRCVSSSRLCFWGEANETHLKGQRGPGSWLSTEGSRTAVLTSSHHEMVALQFLLCSVLQTEERTAGLGQAPCLWLYDTL